MLSKPIGEICNRHGMNYHCNADDTMVLSKNTPKFLTQHASLTKLPSNSSWQPVNSCDRGSLQPFFSYIYIKKIIFLIDSKIIMIIKLTILQQTNKTVIKSDEK
jgi:hypothetical protein